MIVKLPFQGISDRLIAAQFVAELVRSGISFTASPDNSGADFVITLTGGF